MLGHPTEPSYYRRRYHRWGRINRASASVLPEEVIDERTPLKGSSGRTAYGPRGLAYSVHASDDGRDDEETVVFLRRQRMAQASRKTEDDVVFGRWPWRLFNSQWWWWKLEPVICCCYYVDDSDSEVE